MLPGPLSAECEQLLSHPEGHGSRGASSPGGPALLTSSDPRPRGSFALSSEAELRKGPWMPEPASPLRRLTPAVRDVPTGWGMSTCTMTTHRGPHAEGGATAPLPALAVPLSK